jgi:hypothetical protein
VQDTPFRVTALASKIKFAMTEMFTLVESHTKLNQLGNPSRPFGHNRADYVFVAKSCSSLEGVADVELE